MSSSASTKRTYKPAQPAVAAAPSTQLPTDPPAAFSLAGASGDAAFGASYPPHVAPGPPAVAPPASPGSSRKRRASGELASQHPTIAAGPPSSSATAAAAPASSSAVSYAAPSQPALAAPNPPAAAPVSAVNPSSSAAAHTSTTNASTAAAPSNPDAPAAVATANAAAAANDAGAQPPPAKKGRTNTPWTAAEEQRLKTLRTDGGSWSEIAKHFPGRTEGSVKKHWYKDMHYAEFGEDEHALLLAAIKEYEANKWKTIGAKVGKPPKACEQYAKEHFGHGRV